MSDPKITGFELLEKVGQGGMGVVWKARQLSLDRIVAIKFLTPSLSQDPANIQAIMSEARMAAKLKHPGIVQVYDAGVEDGCCYFVMEYIDGYSVGQWLKRKRLISPKEALLVAEHVAVALDYAYQTAGLIHCDIKPENVMVDQDGAIKVADLGLSRTVETKASSSDEIAGTPGFMSPEQANGATDLDCRTDIYSLGATLYNMVTGSRLFQEFTGDEAIEQHVSGSVGDPRDIIPGLPSSVCRLLERMLVRDRALRPGKWVTVLSDMRRVQKGLPPASKAPPPGASTLRLAGPPEAAVAPAEPNGRKPPAWKRWVQWFVVAALLGGVAFVALRYWADRKGGGADGGAGGSGIVGAIKEMISPSGKADNRASEAYRDILEWMRDYPESVEEAMGRLNEFVRDYPGSPESERALAMVKALRLKADQAALRVWPELRAEAERLSQEGRVDEAIRMLESYTGAGSVQSASNRLEFARQLRRLLASEQLAKLQKEQWQTFLAGVADRVLGARMEEASEAVAKAAEDPEFASHKEDLQSMRPLFKGGSKIDERVLASFAGETGKVVKIRVGQAVIPVKVLDIKGQKVHGMAVEEQSEIFIGAAEMAPAEKLARIGATDSPDMAMVKGVLCVQTRAFDRAAECFASAGSVLSPVLVQRLEALTKPAVVDPAEVALRRVLALGGIKVGPYEEAGWLGAIKSARLDKATAVAVGLERERFLEKFGASEFSGKAAPVLLEFERVCEEAKEKGAPVSPAPVEEPKSEPAPTAGESAPAQDLSPDVVAMSFVSSNPDLTPKNVSLSKTPDGQIELCIKSSRIRDLAPLSRLKGISALVLESGVPSPLPVDLKPIRGTGIISVRLNGYIVKELMSLRGANLRVLAIPGSQVVSLSPLEGMPLVDLDVSRTLIRELGALHGMKLETLRLDDVKITSVAQLAGMPLKVLSLRNTGVRDLSCLRGMPLEVLDLSGVPAIDFEGIKGGRINDLSLRGTQVRDISFCAKMPLTALDIGETPVQDIRPLKGLKLDRLSLSKAPIRDMDVLKGASIKTLDLSGMRIPIRDLTDAVKGVTVETLDLSGTDITTLSCLAGHKELRVLNIANTRVRSLAPLVELKLDSLDCRGCPIEDFSLFRTLTLTELWCDVKLERYKEFFEAMPNLKRVNGRNIRVKPGDA